MLSNLGGVAATGMAHVVDVSGTFGASAHPAHPIAAAHVGTTPRKRRAAYTSSSIATPASHVAPPICSHAILLKHLPSFLLRPSLPRLPRLFDRRQPLRTWRLTDLGRLSARARTTALHRSISVPNKSSLSPLAFHLRMSSGPRTMAMCTVWRSSRAPVKDRTIR